MFFATPLRLRYPFDTASYFSIYILPEEKRLKVIDLFLQDLNFPVHHVMGTLEHFF